MNDLINNFNYDSPELREQLDTIGMTPDEVSAQGAMCPVFPGAAAAAELLTQFTSYAGAVVCAARLRPYLSTSRSTLVMRAQVLQKIMAEPELAQAFSKPEVQAVSTVC